MKGEGREGMVLDLFDERMGNGSEREWFMGIGTKCQSGISFRLMLWVLTKDF